MTVSGSSSSPSKEVSAPPTATTSTSSSAAATVVAPVPPKGRKATISRHFANSEPRRRSFLMDLEDQVQEHRANDAALKAQSEILALHRILSKPPEVRDADDIETLYEWVMRNGSTIKIFQGAQEIICKTICREMTLLELPTRGVVCVQGDYGDIFFIIITGSVSLYVDNKSHARQSSNQMGTGPRNMSPPQYQRRLSLRDHRSSAANAMPRRDSSEMEPSVVEDELGNLVASSPAMYGTFIKTIGAGGTFGELAVMDPTARRSCTILCDEATSFICLKRAAYQRLIRVTNSSHLDFTQVEFLETLFYFDRWPHTELTRLSSRLKQVDFAADTFLTRIGTENNVVFFIYAGTVQETIPLVHHLNENGQVVKCATLASEAMQRAGQDLTLLDRRQQQQMRRRVALELNVYQDHDVCGEYPVVFHKTMSQTDLLAITDVRTLVMDRETWRDLFFMHGLEHIRETHHKLRRLAQSRENWRQTRIKLAVANPGLHLTISTRAMMQDGKCICGWCGSSDHITGDAECPVLCVSKLKQADKEQQTQERQQRSERRRVAQEISHKANAVKNTLQFVNQLAEVAAESRRTRHQSTQPGSTVVPEGEQLIPRAPGVTRRGAIVRKHTTLKAAAEAIIHERPAPALGAIATQLENVARLKQGVDGGKEASPLPQENHAPEARQADQMVASDGKPTVIHGDNDTKTMSTAKQDQQTNTEPAADCKAISACANAGLRVMTGVPRGVSNLFEVYRALGDRDGGSGDDADDEDTETRRAKVEDVRKGAFTEVLETEYRQVLVKKMKRLSQLSLQQYYETRTDVLTHLQQQDPRALLPSVGTVGSKSTNLSERNPAPPVHPPRVPRKPKIPKQQRRLAMFSKNREPRPDRFNRRVNRMMRKIWVQEHPLPVVEESLRDP